MEQAKTASRAEWLIARKALLKREKQLTHLQDEVAAERRKLPRVRIDKDYVFDTPEGKKTLADLFGPNSQLIIYHFMYGPDWKQGCVGCSFLADHFDGPLQHLKHHDISFAAVSRAPLSKLNAYKERMGWNFDWVSSGDSDFNYDFGVSFRKEDLAKGKVTYNFEEIETQMEDLHGMSVFTRDETGNIYHTYSSYGRGDERALGAYAFLDLTPNGRGENGPNFALTDWVKRHDEYQPQQQSHAA
jgi:predicted dithiol-disulfide oxidoreductase (DUF899 family)